MSSLQKNLKNIDDKNRTGSMEKSEGFGQKVNPGREGRALTLPSK